MRKIAIITALLLTTTSASAGQYLMIGRGTASCASWLSNPTSEMIGGDYVQGLWTGLNAFNVEEKHDVGRTTDGLGIIAEVKKTCTETPSELLANATMLTWLKILRREEAQGK